MAIDHHNGLWTVRQGTQQWSAWREWRKIRLGLHVAPESMTVTSEWPPADMLEARTYAAKQNAIFEKLDKGRRVPENPKPWDGHIPDDWQGRVEPTAESKAKIGRLIEDFCKGKRGQTSERGTRKQSLMPTPSASELERIRSENDQFQLTTQRYSEEKVA